MILVGIDIGKNQHTFSIIDKGTGEILSNPSVFNNNQEGFLSLIKKLSDYAKSEPIQLTHIASAGSVAFLTDNLPTWYIVIDSSNGHLQIYLLLSINLLIRG